jgi:CubicO group peptidase (beta-lactamase class C family)
VLDQGMFASRVVGLLLLGGCAATPSPRIDVSKQQPSPATPAVGDLGVQPENLGGLTAFVESIGAGWGEASRFSGFVLVAQHDQPIYARAFGFADRDQKRPAGADTSFRIGSITKQFTAAAILRLEQAGKLALEDPVGKHLPEYPGPGKAVTIHQLLTHTSGVPSYTNDPSVVGRKGERWTVPALLATFWSKPLEFAPGTDHAYSNSGYAVLGAIVERASGRDYATFLREELFLPAGMTRTVVGDAEGDPDRALGYQGRGDTLIAADPIDMSLAFAGGSIRSTASDLARWHRALAGEAILSGKTRAKLYTPALENYAYGWISEEILGRQALWHNGAIDGFHADYWRIPDADLVVVVLGNSIDIDTQPIAKAAVAAAFGHKLQPMPQPRLVELDPSLIPRLTGTYRLSPESKRALVESKAPAQLIASIATVTITGAPGGIEMKPSGQSPVKLSPTGIAEFFDPTSKIKASFDFAKTPSALRLTIEQGLLKIIYRRARPGTGRRSSG